MGSNQRARILKFKRENPTPEEFTETLPPKAGAILDRQGRKEADGIKKINKKPRNVSLISKESDIKEKVDWKMERLFFDAWITELEEATFRRYARDFPDKPESFRVMGSTVTTDGENDSGTYAYVNLGGAMRYAVHKKNGMIYEVHRKQSIDPKTKVLMVSTEVNKKKCFGPVRNWDEWNWEPYYPARKNYAYEANRTAPENRPGDSVRTAGSEDEKGTDSRGTRRRARREPVDR